MKKYLAVCFLSFAVLCLPAVAVAQDPTQVPDPLESGAKFSVSGGYAWSGNQALKNGSVSNVEVRFGKHWYGYGAFRQVNTPAANGFLAGAAYDFSAAHIVPKSSFVDTSKIEFVLRAGGGAMRGGADSAPYKPAFEASFAVRYRVSESIFFEPVRFGVLRSSATGTLREVTKPDFGALVGYRF